MLRSGCGLALPAQAPHNAGAERPNLTTAMLRPQFSHVVASAGSVAYGSIIP
jgi:hypothetical protein